MEDKGKEITETRAIWPMFPVAVSALAVTAILMALVSSFTNIGPPETAKIVESDEREQKRAEERLKMEQYLTAEKHRRETFLSACNYYEGSNGVIQNYGKAEELFRDAAQAGASFAPHYLVKILADKYNKLEVTDRTSGQIKECYFWFLIAQSYSKLHEHDSYYCSHYIGRLKSVFGFKGFFEESLSPSEIQKIQDEAGDWWEARLNAKS